MSTGRPRSLADDLRGRDDEALVALLRARPDLTSPVPSDVASLAARATTRPSVAAALDSLDLFTLQVLEAVAALPEPVPPDEVGAALGGDPAPALAVLHGRALVYRDDEGRLLVPRTVQDALGRPAGLGPPLVAALAAYGPRRLSGLAADLGLAPAGDPVRTAEAVAAHLTAPGAVADLLATAAPAAREALDALTWGPPTGRVADAHRDVTVATATTAVDWLLARGLLVAADSRTVVLPREIALVLRGGQVHRDLAVEPPPHPGRTVERAAVDRATAGAAATLVRQVEDLLELWSTAPPRVLRAGGIGVRDRARTAGALDVDEATSSLLAEVALAAGLVAAGDAGDDEAWLPTPAYDAWLDRSVAARWVALVVAWRDSARVVGLAGSSDTRGRTRSALGPDLERTQAPALRRAALAELAALAPDEGTTPAHLAARLHWHAPRRGGQLRDDLVAWTLSEAVLLGLCSDGALGTAGRLLAAGDTAAAEDAIASALPAPVTHVLLQADLTAVAPGPLDGALARRLRLVADVESTGGATVYRFGEAGIRRAFDAGWTAGDVLDLLRQSSRTPVPQPLEYLVEDVARRHGRLRVAPAVAVVRCDDATVLDELLSDRRAGSLRLRRLAATVLAAQAPVDVVLDRLRDIGYAPAAEGADGDVVLRRPEARRASPRRSPAPVRSDRPGLPDTVLRTAVAALRAGDRSTVVARPRPTADLLAMLGQAASDGDSLLIGYVDADGRSSQRVVEPIAVEGGHLSAYDHLRGAVRTFAVHRITGVASVDDDLPEPTAAPRN
jgi:hypothetical protein